MAKISITTNSYLQARNRIDAEFFQEEYLELDKLIGNGEPISVISDTVDLQSNGAFRQIFEILNDKNKKVIPYIRSGNVGDFFVKKDDLYFISYEAHSKLQKTHTKNNDVLMARKGKIGGATIITKDDINYNSNDNVVNIRLKDFNKYNPAYFTAFWNCKYGLKQVERYATGNVQPWLSMKQVRMLKTVFLDYEKQNEISNLVLKAYEAFTASRNNLSNALKIINKEIGINDFPIENKNKSIVSFTELLKANRIDAQCFKPEYLEYKKIINNFGNFDRLSDLLLCVSKGNQKEIRIDGTIPYVSIKDIDEIELVSNSFCDFFQNPAEKNDLLLAITGATIGKVGVVYRNDKLGFSGDLLNLKVNKERIPIYYLLGVLRSVLGQKQIIRWITGATNGHFNPSDINKVLIPRLQKDTESKIDFMVKESLDNKIQSEKLLETAKNKVETYIEKL